MNCVRCTIRRNDGSLEVADLVLAVDPAQWSVDDARDAILAAIRLLESVPFVCSPRLLEVESGNAWRIEVQSPTGSLVTPPLRLSRDVLPLFTPCGVEVHSAQHRTGEGHEGEPLDGRRTDT